MANCLSLRIYTNNLEEGVDPAVLSDGMLLNIEQFASTSYQSLLCFVYMSIAKAKCMIRFRRSSN